MSKPLLKALYLDLGFPADPRPLARDWTLGDPRHSSWSGPAWKPRHAWRGPLRFNRPPNSLRELNVYITQELDDLESDEYPIAYWLPSGSRVIGNAWALVEYLHEESRCTPPPVRPSGEIHTDQLGASEDFLKRDVMSHLAALARWCRTRSVPDSSVDQADGLWWDTWPTLTDVAGLLGKDTSTVSGYVTAGRLKAKGEGRAKRIEPISFFRVRRYLNEVESSRC